MAQWTQVKTSSKLPSQDYRERKQVNLALLLYYSAACVLLDHELAPLIPLVADVIHSPAHQELVKEIISQKHIVRTS